MPTIYKVLGQSAPSATTNTDLYTVPAATTAVASTLSVCNRGTSPTTFRVAVRPGGATLANQHYLVYECSLASYDSILLTLGIAMAATDVMTVYSGSANTSYTLFGSEIS